MLLLNRFLYPAKEVAITDTNMLELRKGLNAHYLPVNTVEEVLELIGD